MRIAFFTGTLGKDWESKVVAGYTVHENSLAVKAGKDGKETMWVKLTQWSEKAGNVMAQYSGKGTKLAVSGDIEVRAYKSSDGEAKAEVNCRVNSFEFMSFKDEDKPATPATPAKQAPKEVDFDTSDIPF